MSKGVWTLNARPPAAPSALGSLEEIARVVGHKRLALFLDFDGTLTPIVQRPELAVLSNAMRVALVRLAKVSTVSVISGRDLQDVRKKVEVDGLHYAGSHGFDIAGADGRRHAPPAAEAALPLLAAAESDLHGRLDSIPGVLLERKRYGLAVHYRMVPSEEVREVKAAVVAALRDRGGLRRQDGKKVCELLPNVAWNKGAALEWLRETLKLTGDNVIVMYLGDDETDEDAFRALTEGDIGIVVTERPRRTSARYRLKDPEEVGLFLELLADRLETRA